MEAVLRQHRAYSRPDLAAPSRVAALRDTIASLRPDADDEVAQISELILPELHTYGELIGTVDGRVAGVMIRGEGEGFTRRIAALMDAWDMTEESKRLHIGLADAFDHKRIFVKLEWLDVDDGERQIAVYYRRRPYVHDALKALTQLTGSCLPLGAFRELGSLLGKETVHFVAFTIRRNRPHWYKFYFSQYLTAEAYAGTEYRLQRAAERFASDCSARGRWTAYHDRLAPRHRRQTVFVSLALSDDGEDESLKIDYPDVPPLVAAGLLDGLPAVEAENRLRALCDAAGRDGLSYLGLRMGRGDQLTLKGYADFR